MEKYIVEKDKDITRWFDFETKKLHRLDGPAVECKNGDKCWYQNGLCHRLDGPAVEYANGDKCWYQNDKRHRLDGPAIEYATGDKNWYQNGQLHRLDGPAVEFANGQKQYWIEGVRYSKEEFEKRVKLPSCDGKVVEIDGNKYRLTEIK